MEAKAKERPILFSAQMVRAILDGRKTQTRRIVKPQPDGTFDTIARGEFTFYRYADGLSCGPIDCRFGSVGDRLWVRETFCELVRCHWWDDTKPKDFIYTTKHPRRNAIAYRAETDSEGESVRKEYGYKWRPSIFMPRWASRITLEVTDVRVQRLWDISEDDAKAEGADYAKHEHIPLYSHKAGFEYLWNSINGPESWDANPWVWAITFKKVEASDERHY